MAVILQLTYSFPLITESAMAGWVNSTKYHYIYFLLQKAVSAWVVIYYWRSTAYTKQAKCALSGVCCTSKAVFFRPQKEEKLREVQLCRKSTARASTPQETYLWGSINADKNL